MALPNGLTYAEYLRTPHWLTMRRLALEAADSHCALCDAAGPLEVHHRTYDRVGAERLRDLVVLCEACHQRHHGHLTLVTDATWAQRQDALTQLQGELDDERRGAMFLAAQVELAYRDGLAAGEARAQRRAS